MDIVKSVSIANMCLQRESFKERIERSFAALEEARQVYDAMGISSIGEWSNRDFNCLGMHEFSSFNTKHFPSAESIVKGFDATAWRYLMAESGLKTFMSSEDIEEWDKACGEKRTAEFTLPNIEATFSKLHEDRSKMLERGIVSVFRGLSWDYKTNQPVKFGPKLVMKIGTYSGSMDYAKLRLVDDLLRFMHVADGAPQPDHRQNFAARFSSAAFTSIGEFESAYISLKGFLNGNAHIKFKRLDLVDKMNLALASRFPDALPAPR